MPSLCDIKILMIVTSSAIHREIVTAYRLIHFIGVHLYDRAVRGIFPTRIEYWRIVPSLSIDIIFKMYSVRIFIILSSWIIVARSGQARSNSLHQTWLLWLETTGHGLVLLWNLLLFHQLICMSLFVNDIVRVWQTWLKTSANKLPTAHFVFVYINDFLHIISLLVSTLLFQLSLSLSFGCKYFIYICLCTAYLRT